MIYLDHHAATPVPPGVRAAMRDAESVGWANPSSTHAAGRAAKQALEDARAKIAGAIGAEPADVVLTGGGTEACNLGVRGLAAGRRRVITTAVEHPAVSASVARLAEAGVEVMELPVPGGEPPSRSELANVITSDSLVALQWVNHETGTIFPVRDYAEVCRDAGARLFIDGTQALGKVAVDVAALGADAVAFAGQKIGAPAGAGACWVRRGVDIDSPLAGGSQERGRRPGTADTLSMVGFGAAATLLPSRLDQQPRLAGLRDAIERHLVSLGGVVNGVSPRTSTASNVSFEGWDGAVLVAALDLEGVCVSTGAACSSGVQAPSEVLLAMYPDEQWRAGSAVRISLGIETRDDEIARAREAFGVVLARSTTSNLNQIRGQRKQSQDSF
ncbi:MAG: cysteine desulfurase family protein [Myxococcota bacterium]